MFVGGIKFITDAGRKVVESKFNFSKLEAVKLSETKKAKINRQKSTGGKTPLINVKKLTTRASDRVGTIHEWAPATDMSVSDSGVYVTIYSGKQFIDADKKVFIEKYNLHKQLFR